MLVARFAAVEERNGHRFKADLSMVEIIAEAEALPAVVTVACWQW
ncbi:hypothetical protein ACIQC7_34405 [Kitasatospora sp. NPDC088556]